MKTSLVESPQDAGSEPHLPVERRKQFFFFSLCLLFAAEGFDFYSYPMLAITALSALYCFYHEGLFGRLKEMPLQIYLPVILAVYTAISPGQWLKDLPVGDKMLASYLTGLGAAWFLPVVFRFSMLCLPAAISLAFLICAASGFSEDFFQNSRLILFSGNANKLAFVAGCGIFISFCGYLAIKTVLRKFFLFTVLMNVVVLFFTLSRSAILATLFSLPFCFQPFLRRNLFTIVKVAVVTIIAIAIGFQSGTINLDETLRKAGQDLTMKQRLIIWEAACRGIGNSPWIGNSLRGFRSYFGKYVEANRADLEEKYGAVENDHSHPHNVVIGLLFMYGIIGLPLFLWAVIPAVKYAFCDYDEVFLVLIVFHFLNGMFDFNLHRVPGALMLFFPVGFVYGTRFRQSAAVGQKNLVGAAQV